MLISVSLDPLMNISDAIYVISLIILIWIAIEIGGGGGGKRSRQPVY